MSRPQTYEQRILFDIENKISLNVNSFTERMCFIEACAAYKSNADINKYWNCLKLEPIFFDKSLVANVSDMIEDTGIPFEMVISSLMREPIPIEEQRKQGAFYTDFRLANYIADCREDELSKNTTVADFAAGTGILLVGIAGKIKKKYPEEFDVWISNHLYAFDLSENALRGATAAVLSMTSNIEAIVNMASKWRVCDSLLDLEIEKLKIDIVVGNPPWGKIKISRHAFALKQNSDRVYGSLYDNFDYEKYEEERKDVAIYSKKLKEKYDLLGKAEPDMYMAFIQKAIQAVIDNNGYVSFIVPAGLIRSQGTKELREFIFKYGADIEIDLLDNKSSFFTIDSRFKFVVISMGTTKAEKLSKMTFSICKTDNFIIVRENPIEIFVDKLKKYRSDLTIPEVKSEVELELFYRICDNGVIWGEEDNQWKSNICREVDMTNDKDKFTKQTNLIHMIPVIEGRMVQQHRFGVKSYISGTGRSAKWDPCPSGGKSQFYISKNLINEGLLERVQKKRVGYCDIAGQTNERAMMSALIPPDVVCGNKVPTLCFENKNEDLLYLWLGITNSFVFDWMIRRIISTTINYFLLFSVPMPNVDIKSSVAKRIICLAKKLESMQLDYYQECKMGELRAEIDVLVAELYGLTFEDLEIIMCDFPILDRKQPCIEGESKSYVTRDAVLSFAEKRWKKRKTEYSDRYEVYKRIGAKAYIPTEMTVLS